MPTSSVAVEHFKVYGYEVAIPPGSRVNKNLFTQLRIRAFSDVEKPFYVSDLAVIAAKSENKKRLFNVREGSDYPAAWLTCTIALQSTYHCRVNKCYFHPAAG